MTPFNDKAYFYSIYNRFWVVQNSKQVINKLNKINSKRNARELSTYDFSTLYTKIPHDDLLNVLCSIIDLVFKGGNKKIIDFSYKEACWARKPKHKKYFTKDSLKRILKYLIYSSYFSVGNQVMQQIIGIPMGMDPAPFFANLYLHHYENKHIIDLIKSNKSLALKYHGCRRFIDDLLALNDRQEFSKSFSKIYPPSLELKLEHSGTHATFLDLDISIKDGIYIYRLFDKRDAFPFFIVRMPYFDSNIPSRIFYSSIMSEFLRIARATLLFEDFLPKAVALYERMTNQGAQKYLILKQFNKLFHNHKIDFLKYNITLTDFKKYFK